MPDPIKEEGGNVKARLVQLEKDMVFLAKGCRHVQEELYNDQGLETFGNGNVQGVEFSES